MTIHVFNNGGHLDILTRLSVCGLGVSCNEMNDTPMLLVVELHNEIRMNKKNTKNCYCSSS